MLRTRLHDDQNMLCVLKTYFNNLLELSDELENYHFPEEDKIALKNIVEDAYDTFFVVARNRTRALGIANNFNNEEQVLSLLNKDKDFLSDFKDKIGSLQESSEYLSCLIEQDRAEVILEDLNYLESMCDYFFNSNTDLKNIVLGQSTTKSFELVNVSLLVDGLYNSFKRYFQSSEVEFLKNYEASENLFVKSDSSAMHRILGNFLSNAYKFTESGGVVFGADELSDKVRLYVRDSGEGISDNDLSDIFKEGFRLDYSKKGHGIGLFSVKNLADQINAEVNVYSKIGEGSEFSLVLKK